jgi:ribosomal protein L9
MSIGEPKLGMDSPEEVSEQKKTKVELKEELDEIRAELKEERERLERLKDFDIAKAMEENPEAFYGKTEIEIAMNHNKQIEDAEKDIKRLEKWEDEIGDKI